MNERFPIPNEIGQSVTDEMKDYQIYSLEIEKVANDVWAGLISEMGDYALDRNLVHSYVFNRIEKHIEKANDQSVAHEAMNEIYDDIEGCPRWLYDQIIRHQ